MIGSRGRRRRRRHLQTFIGRACGLTADRQYRASVVIGLRAIAVAAVFWTLPQTAFASACPPGFKIGSYDTTLHIGTCKKIGPTDCGGGRDCPAGETCVPGGCTGGVRTGPICGPYGHRCPGNEACNVRMGTCYNPRDSYLCGLYVCGFGTHYTAGPCFPCQRQARRKR